MVRQVHYREGDLTPHLYTVAYLENGDEKTIGLNPAWVRPVPTEVSSALPACVSSDLA